MADRVLRLGIHDYDTVAPLVDGRVRLRGIDLRVTLMDLPSHDLTANGAPVDVAEVGIGPYLAKRDGGWDAVALPVIHRRMFVQRHIFVPARSPLSEASQLRGKRIGVIRATNSMAMWARGLLADDFGIRGNDNTWLAQRGPVPESDRWAVMPAGGSLEGLLLSGALDALIIPRQPARELRNGSIRRLYGADTRAVEEDYHRRTGVCPPMHLIALRPELAQDDLPVRLVRAFTLAKQLTFARYWHDPTRVSLLWSATGLERDRRLGNGDSWPFTLSRNRPALDLATRYAHEHGLTSRRWSPDEMFVPSAHEAEPAEPENLDPHATDLVA